MNRKELVLKTFHNEPTDKLLVGFWHHFSRGILGFALCMCGQIIL